MLFGEDVKLVLRDEQHVWFHDIEGREDAVERCIKQTAAWMTLLVQDEQPNQSA